MRRRKALELGWEGATGNRPGDTRARAGSIELGAVDGRPFALDLSELRQHIFIPGASGSGKTTTVACIVDGHLANGCGAVIVDCKGTGLDDGARTLSKRHGVPLHVVDPRDPRTLGYDPCQGDAAAIANKLVGAFTFSAEAEIYKQIAMEVVPVICRALQRAGVRVTLAEIQQCLGKGAMPRLGRQHGVEPELKARLEDLDDAGRVSASGYQGLQHRLGALLEGVFGAIFVLEPALSWSEVTKGPQISYLSLSATAAGEDVELFARVIAKDLKQLCDERMRAISRSERVDQLLVIFDEFAALREAPQVVDLLLQARQARVSVLIATQFLPEAPAIRKPALSSGVLISHRLDADDAEVIASQFGTRSVPLLTAQVDYETGESRVGSMRMAEEFNVHPNVIKALPAGRAAVISRISDRKDVVAIHRVI
jgi:hypothetical protein